MPLGLATSSPEHEPQRVLEAGTSNPFEDSGQEVQPVLPEVGCRFHDNELPPSGHPPAQEVSERWHTIALRA
jgi:hypothetical protein